jgi:DNA-binding NarL/FixJ family response regulator
MKALVLDDHRMVGQALAALLREVAGVQVLGACSSVQECSSLIAKHKPNLLVVDVKLKGENYRDAVDLLHQHQPKAQLLFVTALGNNFRPPAELQPFTVAVVDKACAWTSLLDAVEQWRRLHQQPIDQPTIKQMRLIETLAPRERKLVLALGRGMLNKEIAKDLQLKEDTIKTYRKQVALKLGVSGPQLIRLATLYRSWCLNAG